MRVPRSSRSHAAKINLTPLIDVVFNLVIFFLVVSHFSQAESTEQVDLPVARQGQRNESPHRLTILVRADGTRLVHDRAVTDVEIADMLQQAQALDGESLLVRIQGDRAATYHLIEPILVQCARLGITNVGFDVLAAETEFPASSSN